MLVKFIDIKYGDEKDGEGLFIAKGIVILNGVYKDIEELISAIDIGCKSATNHICISNNKMRQAEKSLYGLPVKMMGTAKRHYISLYKLF